MPTIKLPKGIRRRKEYQDASGAKIPGKVLDPANIVRQHLVEEIIEKAILLQNSLTDFQFFILSKIAIYKEWMSTFYKLPVSKNENISITSFDGKYKLEIKSKPYVKFGPELQMAIEAMREVLEEETVGIRPEVKELFFQVFMPASSPEFISVSQINRIMAIDIPDKRWKNAKTVISRCKQTLFRRSYPQIYIKKGKVWVNIPCRMNHENKISKQETADGKKN